MKVLGLITARGGSKGIPGKNLVPVGGKSLLAWTAEAALASRSLARTIISTDDEPIRQAALALGVDAPFVRPQELATDTAKSTDVVIHALQALATEGDEYEAVMVLQPTCPLRTSALIDEAVDLMASTGCDSVISFVPVGERHPARMKAVDSEGRVVNPPFVEAFEGQPRQQLPPYYLRDGAIYLASTSLALSGSLQGPDCRALITKLEDWCNIDDPFDLEWAEFLIARKRRLGEIS